MDTHFENPYTQEQLEEGIRKWPTSVAVCTSRATAFQALKEHLHDHKNASELFKQLQLSVQKAEPLLRTFTDVEKEGYQQVCFTGSPWSALNAVPFALLALSVYKSYIVPGLSVLLPFVSWLFPFVLLRTFWNIPISFQDYTKLLWRMWNGHPLPRNPKDLLAPLEPTPPSDLLTQGRTLIQNGWTLMTFGQAIYHPIQQARHFHRLDKDCLALGQAVVDIRQIAHLLLADYKPWLPTWLASWVPLCPSSAREAFAFALENPVWLKQTLRALGRLEVLHTLALRPDTTAPRFLKTRKPHLTLRGFGDPNIPLDSRVLSDLQLGSQQFHGIVTGPNRGGKSSFLRGVLLNVHYAHAFGAVFADSATLSFYTWIADGLRLHDTPGQASMFEREVGFASGILKKTEGCGLVLYDEIFHSTNPPDATRSSELFCDSLWKKTNCISLLSTHIYSLADSAPQSLVKPLCLASWRKGSKYLFSYKVKRGVCKVSSVDLLLKQADLL